MIGFQNLVIDHEDGISGKKCSRWSATSSNWGFAEDGYVNLYPPVR